MGSQPMVVGVIPAAGHGTRLQPLTGSKELVDLNGRPAFDYLHLRMQLAEPTTVRVVTRREKVDLVDHARGLGAEIVLGWPATLSESLRLGIDGLSPETIVLFGFPDSVWTPVDGFVRLRAAVESGRARFVLGVFETRHPERCEIVTLRPDETLGGILYKPARPPSNLMWGVFAARAGELAGLERFDEPGLFIDDLCRGRSVGTIRLGEYLDVGTRDALEAVASDPMARSQAW